MLALIQITPWHWAGFILCILFFLALDLGIFHRGARIVKLKEALGWSILWVALSLAFATALVPLRGHAEAAQFITGYVIELSLSLDNVFVIALIFTFFQVPPQSQHRLLFWGILGALVLRGAMILGGAALIARFQWTLYLFGVFLIFTGVKMIFTGNKKIRPEKNPVIRLARKIFPVAENFHGENFFIRDGARIILTPLALVLLMIETTDLVFALDSIPAIFAVTTKAFIVFTSNVFAILGLRSLYFLLAGAMAFFRYFKAGLAIVLIFVGAKMLLAPHHSASCWFQFEIPIGVSLLIIAAILAGAILFSIIAARSEKKN
jgi:tellurite resistance protein TerC